MSADKTRIDFVSHISSAVERTLGKRKVVANSFFKKDLGFSSIDFIDFFFELEQSIGEQLNVRKILLSLSTQGRGGDDLQVSELVEHLLNLVREK